MDTLKIDNEPILKPTPFPVLLEDHAPVLEKYGLNYKSTGIYYEIGELSSIQGWIIDISIIPVQFHSLLEALLPILRSEKLVFTVIKDAKNARAVMNGNLGYQLLGKFISIYIVDEIQLVNIVTQLIELTKQFKGPDILTDRHLGSVVYTRYGAHKGIVFTNDNGLEEKYIYNSQGNIIKDPYTIPFVLLEGVSWPFGSISHVKAPKKETVLQERYRPMAIIKEDAKGSVRKGLYLEKYWQIKWCIIKEGKRSMLGDSKGRDITDRLRWQYELHKELDNSVPIPKIYDFFDENGDAYLVMEYIKGQPLHYAVNDIQNGRTWWQLTIQKKSYILNICTKVLDIIQIMHEKGYIHRDITPANFLITRKEKIWMIDLELSYCVRSKKPYWPFRLGTPGFMSPEQENTLIPTIEQDIYAIGALFIFLFTGLMPDKFSQEDSTCLKIQLNFFIVDEELIALICSCLEKEPEKRPSIPLLKETIQEFAKRQTQIKLKYTTEIIPKNSFSGETKLENTIKKSLKGLKNDGFLNEEKLWVSHSGHEDSFSYGHDGSVSVYTGYYQGISGIVWLLARAHKLKFSIEMCREEFNKTCNS